MVIILENVFKKKGSMEQGTYTVVDWLNLWRVVAVQHFSLVIKKRNPGSFVQIDEP